MEQILIIEDDFSLNQGLCRALKQENRQMIPCPNLKIAREQLLCSDPALVLLAPAGSCLQQAAKEQGVSFGCEVFADRAYEADGSLRVVFPRTAGVPAEFDQIRKDYFRYSTLSFGGGVLLPLSDLGRM